MKILVVDSFGEFLLDWILRCLPYGHKIKWFIDPSIKRSELIGKGVPGIDKVKDWREWARWADLILVADNTKYLTQLERVRKEGVRVVGPSPEMAAWELDRKLGMGIFQRCGIPCPPYREFTDYDQAIKYVTKQDRAFVSKPCGVETDKSLSYVASSPEDMVYMLNRWKRQGKIKGSFILQEKIKGIEFAVGGWFGPHGWNQGWEENWEHKKLMYGDCGPNCGESGTVMRWTKKSKLANEVLKPLTKHLEKAGYIGNIDVNCIIDETGYPWPLEFTCRPGVPAYQIQQALTKGDPAQWLADLADGRDTQEMNYDDVAVGIVMTLPPYPYADGKDEECCGVPIYGITQRNINDLHFSQVQMGETYVGGPEGVTTGQGWLTAGPYVLCATGVAETVQKARNRANAVLEQLRKTPGGVFWRPDIGNRLSRQLPELQKMGYAIGMEFSDAEPAS